MSSPAEPDEIREVVPRWRRSATLDALKELIDLSAAVPTAIGQQAGLSTTEMHALTHLLDEPVGPVNLARRLGVTSAAASGIVDRLEGRGHVARAPHERDRRRTVVNVTDSGRREIVGYLAPMFASLAELDASLTDDERAAVDRFLACVIAALHRIL